MHKYIEKWNVVNMKYDTISWNLPPVSLMVKCVYSFSWTALNNLIIHHNISFDLLDEMCFRKPGSFHNMHTLLIVELNTYFMIRRETQTLSQTLLCSKWNLD